jgi:hypothetical protein
LIIGVYVWADNSKEDDSRQHKLDQTHRPTHPPKKNCPVTITNSGIVTFNGNVSLTGKAIPKTTITTNTNFTKRMTP